MCFKGLVKELFKLKIFLYVVKFQDSVDGTSTGKHHEFSMNHGVGFHHANFVPQVNFMRPVVPRGSHSSDTSSAYSGSDTMQVESIICLRFVTTMIKYLKSFFLNLKQWHKSRVLNFEALESVRMDYDSRFDSNKIQLNEILHWGKWCEHLKLQKEAC